MTGFLHWPTSRWAIPAIQSGKDKVGLQEAQIKSEHEPRLRGSEAVETVARQATELHVEIARAYTTH